MGQSPSQQTIWCIFALKSDIWWQQFNNFPENQLTKFCAFYDYNTFQRAKATLSCKQWAWSMEQRSAFEAEGLLDLKQEGL